MNKAEYIAAINAAEVEGVNIPEDTKITVPQLKLMHDGITSKETIKELNRNIDTLNETVGELEAKATLSADKVVAKFGGKNYQVVSGGKVPLEEGHVLLSQQEIAENEEALKFLVEKKSGLLKIIE